MKKDSTPRVHKLREKRRQAGYTRCEFWLTTTERDIMRAYLEVLRDAANRPS